MVLASGWQLIDRMLHQAGVEHDRHPAVGVVDGGERRHRAGHDAERLHQQVGGAEREAARGPEPAVQGFQLDRGVFLRR